MQGKNHSDGRKDKIVEWVIVISIIVVCGLFSRFVLKEWVADEHYKAAGFGLLALGFVIFYPLLTRFLISKDK